MRPREAPSEARFAACQRSEDQEARDVRARDQEHENHAAHQYQHPRGHVTGQRFLERNHGRVGVPTLRHYIGKQFDHLTPQWLYLTLGLVKCSARPQASDGRSEVAGPVVLLSAGIAAGWDPELRRRGWKREARRHHPYDAPRNAIDLNRSADHSMVATKSVAP